ncbi:hypothetical protein HNQ91_004808 [Filimonas zeae]|nr:TonB-dependent receptor [Filimonas zeae]MDR6341735.1 hypothetical protein [Filimonas zeae]
MRKFALLAALLFVPFCMIMAQVTTSTLGGTVKAPTGAALDGAVIVAKHEPTGSVYQTISKGGGKYTIGDMTPGGPYTITVSFVNLETVTRKDVFLVLGEAPKIDIDMQDKSNELAGVVVTGRAVQGKNGVGTSLGKERLAVLPTVGRNITDYLRATPQVKYTSNEGAISIAGQNNRYNAFYIDGAINNDVFGLAASGTNGGQANIAPISLDAIDQIQVMISPYDASLGNFTGGGINVVTKSGTNTFGGSIYHVFRNQSLAGKTPTGNKSNAIKIPDFSNKTTGFTLGGPIIKNKLFYFISGEMQRDERPQPFDTSFYTGNTKGAALQALADTLLRRYNYNGGGFINNPEKVKANRITAKIDWNISNKNKLSLSYRYNDGERNNVSSSSSRTINFYNNGYKFPSTSHSASAELRTSLNHGASNRLLITYTNVKDNRDPLGNPFPRVTLTDGAGSIIFGTDNSSTVNLLTQKNYTLFDAYKFSTGKHSFSVGTDNEMSDVYNAFIQNTFGNYTYGSVNAFLTGANPTRYQVGYPLVDNKTDETTSAAAKFKTLRLALFFNDEFRPTDNLTLNFGVRADYFNFLTKPGTDDYTNNTAIPVFEQYYDLKGARSGLKPTVPVSVSPRFGFTYKIPAAGITLRGGTGMFTGRIPLVWPGGIYNNNGFYQAGLSVNNPSIAFRPNPYGQYRAADLGATLTKGNLNLISSKFRLPKVFRTSLAIDKQVGDGWTLSLEGSYTKNVNEVYYTNINLAPAIGTSKGPGSRNVYLADNAWLPVDGTTSPYGSAILLSNYDGAKKGSSYNVTFTVDKRFRNGWSFNANYNYGRATVIHEPTSSTNTSQWQFMETVNGRNSISSTSYSDFDMGHRFFAYGGKTFNYAGGRLATTVSLVYNGQSGNRFSYVYGGNAGMVRDAAPSSSVTSDLVYIPTQGEVASMTFLSNTVGTSPNTVTYTPDQQKQAFNKFIESNPYLKAHRGQFAERNGDRMPFQHVVDLRIAQDFNLVISGHKYKFQVIYDMNNFTNFLNRKWGRTYFLSNDQFRLLDFAGYVSNADLTPQYRFTPTIAQPQSEANVSTSTAPSFTARWMSQFTLRFIF